MIDIASTQAIRCAVELEPVDGPGGRIFPPTYPGARDVAQHVVETLPDGTCRVLIDSVASQANRHEEALVEARKEGLADFSDVYLDLSKTKAGLDELSATQMPHRLSDAILRDSEIGDLPFGRSVAGQKILSATTADLSPLIEASPTTLLFGCWFSQHNLPRPLKIQRSVVSEVWAHNAVLGKSVGSRIDPLGIEKLKLYEAADGDWTALESEAEQVRGVAKIHAKKRPSEINHGNIAPSIRDQGITAERITLNWAMPMAAIRKLHFGGADRDSAGQAYLVALGILSRVLAHRAGYSFRSRCDLISTGPATFEIIGADGQVTQRTITLDDSLGMLRQAEEAMSKAGLKIHQKIRAKPGNRLAGLIEANAAHQAAGDDSGDDE